MWNPIAAVDAPNIDVVCAAKVEVNAPNAVAGSRKVDIGAPDVVIEDPLIVFDVPRILVLVSSVALAKPVDTSGSSVVETPHKGKLISVIS